MGKQKDRFYKFAIVTYNSIEAVQEFVKQCDNYFYILHDRDETDDHIHIACTMRQQKSFKWIREAIKGDQNTLVEELIDGKAYYQYVTHINEEHKAEYSEDEIVTNNRKLYKPETEETNRKENLEFIEDILGEMTKKELGIKYGRDYMKNMKAYDSYREAVKHEEATAHIAEARFTEFQDFVLKECTQCTFVGSMLCLNWKSCKRQGRPTGIPYWLKD